MAIKNGELPPSLQQQIARLQQLHQTLNVILVERQRLEAELIEVKNAIEELGKISDEVSVYKAVGPVLVQSSRQKLLQELNEKKELAETRLKILEKQEQRTRGQLDTLQKEVQSALSEKKLS
ncbi:MAG: prefoldin subunit beta [Aigarchaeota archaeon]|nr:prefoldin subunit beta [Aigarchaeota archaeon]MCX8193623.1 prefoldin subunit beta [Nitrososphaeria archaeon]MDW7987023.1 prefoldin subunit beta [Nitrososphaerota archaeon]